MAANSAPAGAGVELTILAVSVWTFEGPWLRICVDKGTIVYALVDPDVYPRGWQHENVEHAPPIELPFFAKEWIGHWNVFRISRNPTGIYFSATARMTFREIGTYAHMPTYDYLALERDCLLHKGIRWTYNDRLAVVKSPVGSEGKPIWGTPLALMKIVPFPGELFGGFELAKRMDVEIRAHARAAIHECAPSFIGLVVETNRVIGYLSEFMPKARNFRELGHELSRTDFHAVSHLLERLHATGIVHNDLHPGNILRDADGTVVLVDFEMASTRDECNNPEQFNAYARWETQFLRDSLQGPAARALS